MFRLEITVPRLQIEAMIQPGGGLLRCAGEIDLSSVSWLELAFAVVTQSRAPQLWVDLQEIDFLDVSAMRALVVADRALAAEGRTMSVRLRPRAAALFRLVHLDRVLDLQSAVEGTATPGHECGAFRTTLHPPPRWRRRAGRPAVALAC